MRSGKPLVYINYKNEKLTGTLKGHSYATLQATTVVMVATRRQSYNKNNYVSKSSSQVFNKIHRTDGINYRHLSGSTIIFLHIII